MIRKVGGEKITAGHFVLMSNNHHNRPSTTTRHVSSGLTCDADRRAGDFTSSTTILMRARTLEQEEDCALVSFSGAWEHCPYLPVLGGLLLVLAMAANN